MAHVLSVMMQDDIVELVTSGCSYRRMTRQLGVDRGTVARYAGRSPLYRARQIRSITRWRRMKSWETEDSTKF